VIEEIIAEEIRRSRNNTSSSNKENKLMMLTPVEKQLSETFIANKGKLPWPTERGMISSSYGKHAHPVSDKIMVTNNGIDISTPANAMARSVFDGVVVSVNKITASNNAVIIRHGEYFTVYSNLDEVYVSRGDRVKTKQNIGRIHTEKSEGKTEIHFELWKEKGRQNPELWLSK
jgi:Membrane proteins related to metalloendopeptidases